jgi:hypothetical protein
MLETQGNRLSDHRKIPLKVSETNTCYQIIKIISFFIEYRYGNVGGDDDNVSKKITFFKYFDNFHMRPIYQCYLNIILAKRYQFVGTKTLYISLRNVKLGIKILMKYDMIQEHINTIIYEICLPLMLISQKEY